MVFKPGVDKLQCVGVWCDKLGNFLLGKMHAISTQSHMYEYTREREVNVLGMSRVADFVQGVDQGVLTVGFECNTEVYRGSAGGWP